VDLDALRTEARHEKARVVALCHIPTGGGLVNPAEEVGRIAKERGLIYLLDACQVSSLHHKSFGPRV
jgi:cysteine desulfurase/selenocysteine lyase